MSARAFFLLVATAAVAATFMPQPGQSQGPLALVRTIELPGVNGRIDHLAIDPARHALYVAALGNNTVETLDIGAGKDQRSVPGFSEPQGIAVVPSSGMVAVANGGTGNVQFFDGETMRLQRSVPLGTDADNVRYDAASGHLFVGYGSGALAELDPANGNRLAEVRLAGHPESFQLERSGPRLFVNIPTAQQVAVVDRAARKVIATWKIEAAGANFPMALDEAGRRLFVGCRRPAKVLVLDTATGAVNASYDIVGDTDDLFYDSTRRRLYVSGGEGFVDVLQQQPDGRFERAARIATAAGARTSWFHAGDGMLYVAVPHRGAQRAEIRVFQARD